MQVRELGHAVIKVRNRERAEAFYGGGLGMQLAARHETMPMTFYTLGNHHDLALLEAADVAVVVPRAGGPHEELRPGLQDGATAWRRQHTERDGPTRPCIT